MPMSSSVRHIILFTRYPKPGTVKTRLISELGLATATFIARRLAERTAAHLSECARLSGAIPIVSYEGADEEGMKAWLGPGFHYYLQVGDDMGDRMYHSFRQALESGASSAVLVGGDIPDLTAEILVDALSALEDHDIVLGPSRDGGYYLIGMSQVHPFLFQGIPWSSDHVLEHTMGKAAELGFSVKLLGILNDIDRPSDLVALDLDSLDDSPEISC